jgi:hypothetical protein
MHVTKTRRPKARQAAAAHASATKPAGKTNDASESAKAPQRREPRPPVGVRSRDDKAAALVVLSSVGVDPAGIGSRDLAQLSAFFREIASFEQDRKAQESQEQRDYQVLARAISKARLLTERGQQLRDCFLRDLQGNTLTISEALRGETRSPILKPLEKGKAGRPNDLAIERTIRDFADTKGWTWEVCAAAVFVTGADKRSYTAIKKSFRDVANRTARR